MLNFRIEHGDQYVLFVGQESLDALQSLPEATLFEEQNVSKVWLEVVERASKFLRSVVEGSVQYLQFH